MRHKESIEVTFANSMKSLTYSSMGWSRRRPFRRPGLSRQFGRNYQGTHCFPCHVCNHL